MTHPKALFLADVLEISSNHGMRREAADELRRGARCGVYSLPMWCDIHQHYKWCEHNGGVMGPTGWEKP